MQTNTLREAIAKLSILSGDTQIDNFLHSVKGGGGGG